MGCGRGELGKRSERQPSGLEGLCLWLDHMSLFAPPPTSLNGRRTSPSGYRIVWRIQSRCAITGPRETTDALGRPIRVAITGLRMKTNCAPHPEIVQALPVTSTVASFFGFPAVHPDPFGLCVREFTCKLGYRRVVPGRGIIHDFEPSPLSQGLAPK